MKRGSLLSFEWVKRKSKCWQRKNEERLKSLVLEYPNQSLFCLLKVPLIQNYLL